MQGVKTKARVSKPDSIPPDKLWSGSGIYDEKYNRYGQGRVKRKSRLPRIGELSPLRVIQ